MRNTHVLCRLPIRIHQKKGFALKFKAALICRGEGKIFFHLIACDDFSFDGVVFSAESESCKKIPVATYTYRSGGGSVREIIVTVPLLHFRKITITAQKNDESYSQSFRYTTITTQSKLAYGLKPNQASNVRSAAENMPNSGVRIAPVSFSETTGLTPTEYIIKGTISVPGSSSHLRLYAIDSAGNRTKELPCSFIRSYLESNIPTKTYSFTFRFSKKSTLGGIVASCDNPLIQDAFFGLDSTNINEALEKYSTRDYFNAKPGHYDLFRENANAHRQRAARYTAIDYDSAPLFSIVTPLYNTPSSFFDEMIQSMLSQTYQKWELVLVNASPENERLSSQTKGLTDPRIKVVTLEKNLGIAENTNRGIASTSGEFIFFLDHDDTLEPETLFTYWLYLSKHPRAEVLYCDEDILDESGNYIQPNFKPDFSIDLLRAHNYITHFLAVRKTLLSEPCLDSNFDGAQDYDLILRLTETAKEIIHIPEILYHWRMSDSSTAKNSGSKTYAIEAGKRALEAHLERCGINAHVTNTDTAFFYHASYVIEGNPLVSIIIPSKDHADMLERCLSSIQHATSYGNFEIIVVENNSSEQETFNYYQSIKNRWSNVTVLTWQDEFNYSKINNFAAKSAKGEYLLLLNNDTEVINPHWIEALLEYCQQEQVGAVGAKLLFPDDTIQHAGIKIYECKTPAESGGPVHLCQHIDRNEPGYMRRLETPHNVSAVTAACLMTKKSLFNEIGGLDERFTVAYNDVDFCLKLREQNYRIVYAPGALLYHHESISRGSDTPSSGLNNYARFLSEQGLFRQKWSKVLAQKDPFHAFG